MAELRRKNLLAGLFSMAFGGFVTWQSLELSVGTPRNMGPGFFPMVLGTILVLIGAMIASAALRLDEDIPSVNLRPVLIIPTALVVFALLIDRVGLLPAALATVLLAGFAQHRQDLIALLVLAVALLLAAYVVFIEIFGVPVPLLEWSL